MLRAERRVEHVDPSTFPESSMQRGRATRESEARHEPVLAPRSLSDRLSLGWVIGLAASWPPLFALGLAIEPRPADGEAPGTVLGAVAALTFLLAVLAAGIGLAFRQRWGAVASLVAAISLVGLSIDCLNSGHHSPVGAWWFGQLMIAGTLAELSRRALRATVPYITEAQPVTREARTTRLFERPLR